MIKKKNRFIATFLSQFPGLGHFYLGLYKRGLTMFIFVVLGIIFQIYIVNPIVIYQIENILTPSFLTDMLMLLLYLPVLGPYGWNMIDAYHQTDRINGKGY